MTSLVESLRNRKRLGKNSIRRSRPLSPLLSSTLPFLPRLFHQPDDLLATRQIASCWAVAIDWPTSGTRLPVPLTSAISGGQRNVLDFTQLEALDDRPN